MLANKNICTGCGACAVSCPINCIEMQSDSEGFRYPRVNVTYCVSCGKCETVCPVLNKSPQQSEPCAYGAKHRDDYIRSVSSSGGVFPALASFTLKKNGAVCGATYTEDFLVEHRIIESVADISKLQGTKYAQSRTEHLFSEIRCILEMDRWVLYVGTPCQTAALKAYLGADFKKLILVDMICHGVPSPLVWEKYLDYRRKRDANSSMIVSVNQRDKVSGWSRYRYSLRIDYENGMSYCVSQSEDVFMRGFVNNLYLRPSCANCKFKGVDRHSDITIGDFWGVWEQYPEFDDDRGTSIVLINTEKGDNFWNEIKDRLNVICVDVREVLINNPSANNCSVPHSKRHLFFDSFEKSNFDRLVSKLLSNHHEKKHCIRNILRRKNKPN